jgi:hypothetical protein
MIRCLLRARLEGHASSSFLIISHVVIALIRFRNIVSKVSNRKARVHGQTGFGPGDSRICFRSFLLAMIPGDGSDVFQSFTS